MSAVALLLTVWAVVPLWSTAALPLSKQPFPDSFEYADSARQLATGHGYVTVVNERHPVPRFGSRRFPPRYPPGTSAALAPFAAAFGGFPGNVQVGSRAISMLYVLAIVAAAWLLGGPSAGAIAALFVGLSPFARYSATVILSDELGALLTVLILIAVVLGSRRSRLSAIAAGILSGALLLVRLLGVVALPAALASVRRRWLMLVCAAPFLIGMAVYQWHTFGSPFKTGYSLYVRGLHQFELSYITHPWSREGPFVYPDKLNGGLLPGICPCNVGGPMSSLPNFSFYPAVLIDLFWVFAPPLTGLIGLVEAIRQRTTPGGRYTLIVVVLSLGLLSLYFDQAVRFMAPAASLLLVYSAVGIAGLMRRALSVATARFRTMSAAREDLTGPPPPAMG